MFGPPAKTSYPPAKNINGTPGHTFVLFFLRSLWRSVWEKKIKPKRKELPRMNISGWETLQETERFLVSEMFCFVV